MHSAVVDLQTNVVVNRIVATASIALPPDGCYLVDITDLVCDIGWIYDQTSKTFIDPNPPPPPPEPAPEEPVV
jgi:hypothetical protein